jgi:hypothetical protein
MDLLEQKSPHLITKRRSKILVALFLAIIISGAIISSIWINEQPVVITEDEPVLVPPLPTVDLGTVDNLLPRDAIPSIDDPKFATIEVADSFMDPDEQVIGLIINGDARAYPLAILSSHEIVNDVVGGEPVAVTWCPLCYTALVFSREVESHSQPLNFGVSGKLLRNTLVMYDRQSRSLWSQLYGAAIDGEMAGTRLAFFPSLLTSWQAWKAEQLETLVLSKPFTCEQFNCGTYSTNPRGSYDIDPYASYYNSAEEGVLNRQVPREEGRLIGKAKKRVLGLRFGSVQRAYPFTVLKDQGLIHDTINDVPIVIWFEQDTESGTAYLRKLDDHVLTFDEDQEEPGILVDQETGGRWSAATGIALSGPLEGRRLDALVVTPAFEFGWYGYFPNSQTYTNENS